MTNKRLAQILDTLTDTTPRVRREALEHSFSAFFAFYFTEGIKYPFADFHFDIFKTYEKMDKGEVDEFLQVLFRESAKTTIAKAFILWCIVYKKKNYIVVSSHDKGNSERILFDVVLHLQTNTKITRDFGHLYNSKRDKEVAQRKRVADFITNNKVAVEAFSTQESARGRLTGFDRPDLILFDDFENKKTIESEAYTKKTRDHILEALGGLSPTGQVVYLANYISDQCNVQMLIDKAKKIEKMAYINIPLYDDSEVLFWPQKYCFGDEEAKQTGKVSVESRKRLLLSSTDFGLSFQQEYLNKPFSDENRKFKREYVRYIEPQKVEMRTHATYITLDSSLGKKDGDYTGVVINHVTSDNKWNIEAFRMKLDSAELIKFLFTLDTKYNPDTIGIEKTVFVDAIEPFLRDEQIRRNRFLNIVELSHQQTKKETRIEGLLPRYSARQIYHIEGLCNDLEEEQARYPHVAHDDVLDALAYQIQIAEAPDGELTKFIREQNTKSTGVHM